MRAGRVSAALALAAVVSLAVPAPASADVLGPCTATLAGRSVEDIDTPGSAVPVDYRETIPYSGQTTNGQVVTFVNVGLSVAGFRIELVERHATNDTTWLSEASVERYAWAGVGLYRVRGQAIGDTGRVICSGTAYVCVEGKSPLSTVAGGAGAGLVVLAAILLVLGLRRRRRASRPRLATRFGSAGLLGGLGAPILLQQFCILPLSPLLAFAPAGLALLLGALLGLLMGAGPISPTPAPPSAPARPEDEDRPAPTIYQFSPSAGACRACKSHSTHRVYASSEAMATDRAHTGCKCAVVAQQVDQMAYVAYFQGGGYVYDDRGQ
ncbi:MAG: hypothetical protein ACT4PO_08655 [Actinomycetota bacterium]